jgi:hypothetical protein
MVRRNFPFAGIESARGSDDGTAKRTFVVANDLLFLPGCTCFQQAFFVASNDMSG